MGLVDIREANMQKGIKLLWETDIRSGVFGMVDSEMWQKKKYLPQVKTLSISSTYTPGAEINRFAMAGNF